MFPGKHLPKTEGVKAETDPEFPLRNLPTVQIPPSPDLRGAAAFGSGQFVGQVGTSLAQQNALTPEELEEREVLKAVIASDDPLRYDLRTSEGRFRVEAAANLLLLSGREMPEFRDLYRKSVEAAQIADNVEWIVGGADKALGRNVYRNLLRAAADMIDETVNPFRPAEAVMADAEPQAQWTLNMADDATLWAEVTDDQFNLFNRLGDQPITARVYDNRLIVTAERTERGSIAEELAGEEGREASRNLIDIQLDPGTQLRTGADVIHAINEAVARREHGMIFMDPIRGNQTALGGFVEGLSRAKDGVGVLYDKTISGPVNFAVEAAQELIGAVLSDDPIDIGTADLRTSETLYEQRNLAEARSMVAQVEMGLTTPEALLQGMMSEIRRRNPGMGRYQAAEAGVQYLAMPENYAQAQEAAKLTERQRDEVIREVLESAPEENTLANYMDTGLSKLVAVAAHYGKLLDYTAVHAVDILDDLTDGAAGALGYSQSVTDILTGSESRKTGLAAFTSSWDWAEESRLSELWGVEGTAGTWLDIAANLTIDPFTWIIPSNAARKGYWSDVLSNPARIGELIEQPAMRQRLEGIVGAVAAGNRRRLEAVASDLPFAARMSLMDAAPQTVEEAARIISRYTPGNGGMWLPDWGGRLRDRNTAGRFIQLTENAKGNPKWFDNPVALETMSGMFGGYPRNRVLTLSEYGFSDEIGEQFAWMSSLLPKDDAAKALDRWYTQLGDYEKQLWSVTRHPEALVRTAVDDVKRLASELKPHSVALKQSLKPILQAEGITLSRVPGKTFQEKLARVLDDAAGMDAQRAGLEMEASRLAGLTDDASVARSGEIATRLKELDELGPKMDALIKESRSLRRQANAADKVGETKSAAELRSRAAAADEQLRLLTAGKSAWSRGMSARSATYAKLREALEQHTALTKELQQKLSGARSTLAVQRKNLREFDWPEVARGFAARWEDEVGEQILGLKRLTKGEINPLTGKRELDWTPVTGKKGAGSAEIAPAERIGPLTGWEESPLADTAMLADRTTYSFHATPQQMVAYKMLHEGGWWDRILAHTVIPREEGLIGGFTRAKNGLMKAYFVAALAGPMTAFRSYLDEVTRFWFHNGFTWKRSFKPDLASEPIEAIPFRSRTAAAMELDQGYQMSYGPGQWRPVRRHSGTGPESAYVNDKEHRSAAFSWLNHQLLPDESARALARDLRETAQRLGRSELDLLTDPNAARLMSTDNFASWWMGGGRYKAKGKFAPAGGAPMSSMLDNVQTELNGLAVLAKLSSNPEGVAKHLIDKMVAPIGDNLLREGFGADEWFVRQLGAVPTRSVNADKKMDILGAMYGNPGRNRYGHFHADYQDSALRVFERAASFNPNIVISPQTMIDLGRADNLIDAEKFFARNADLVERLAHENGLWTPRMVEYAADRFARRNAGHLIYTPGASSMFGRLVQHQVPFGPAQYDWMDFWGQEATRTSAIRLLGGKQMELPELRLLGHRLPQNLRLFDRMGQYGNMWDRHTEELQDNPDAQFLPSQVLDSVTFFPRLDDIGHFNADLGPGFGPLPSWTLAMLGDMTDKVDEDDPWWDRLAKAVSGFFTTISPTLDWYDAEGVDGLIQRFAPRTSPIKLIDSLIDAARVANLDPFDSSNAFADSPFIRDAKDLVVMNYLIEHGTTADLTADQVNLEAQQMIASTDVWSKLSSMLPFGAALGGSEDLTTEAWGGFVSELDTALEQGWVGEANVKAIKELWAKLDTPIPTRNPLTPSEEKQLHDLLRTTLFSLDDFPLAQATMIVAHPEVALAMESRYTAILDPRTGLPLDPTGVDNRNRPRQMPDETTDEYLQRLNEGLGKVYAERTIEERLLGVEWRIASAKRELLREAYMGLTGHDSFRPGDDVDRSAYEGKTWNFSEAQAEYLNNLGVRVEPGRIGRQEFARIVQTANAGLAQHTYPVAADRLSNIIKAKVEADFEPDGGADILDALDDAEKLAQEQGFDSPDEWPAEAQEWSRELFASLIDGRGLITVEDYNRVYASKWGPYDFEMELPGPLAELEDVREVYTVDPSDVTVTDGDTLSIPAVGGEVVFRLIGINTPDDPQPGWEDAYLDLNDLIHNEGYGEVQLVIWRPEFFGTEAGNVYGTNQPRLKAWLYIDGQPVYHESSFTWRNPTGRASRDDFRPLPRPQKGPVS